MTDRSNNAATGIVGKRIGLHDRSKECNYYICDECGQAVDMRNLGEVFHHKDAGHKPLPVS